MPDFIPWNSQPLEDWTAKYAAGKVIELDGLSTHYVEKGTGEPVILPHGFSLPETVLIDLFSSYI